MKNVKEMNFNSMIRHLRNGAKIRRSDWGYFENVYIKLMDWYGNDFVYIHNTLHNNPEHIVFYGFSMIDIDSEKWEIVE